MRIHARVLIAAPRLPSPQSVLTLPSARSLQVAPLPSTETQPTVPRNVRLGDLQHLAAIIAR